MTSYSQLVQRCILSCEHWLQNNGYCPKVHFELEGMVALPFGRDLDFSRLDNELRNYAIPAQVKKEYWRGQWEYVSDMNGQSPLQEAQYLHRAMKLLPLLMKQQGASGVFLDPVIWHGSQQRYAQGSNAIFAEQTGTVHVPNAIQINVSVDDHNGNNLMPDSGIGEWLQYQLLQTSYANCLLYLPEADAYERLALRTVYGLDTELSSPWELSGGYQGSIALYKEKGKHDQPMGVKTLLLGPDSEPLISEENWRETCRVEHRLGATSEKYDPFINVLFTLLNVITAIENWQENQLPPDFCARPLPQSLENKDGKQGALSLFASDNWFSNSINQYCQNMSVDELDSLPGMGLHPEWLSLSGMASSPRTLSNSPGELIKHTILRRYQNTSPVKTNK